MERLEKKCSDLTSLVAAAEGSRDRLQAESHQQAGKIARLMEAARSAESDLSRCKKELAEVAEERRRRTRDPAKRKSVTFAECQEVLEMSE